MEFRCICLRGYFAKVDAFAERCAWLVGLSEGLEFVLCLQSVEVVLGWEVLAVDKQKDSEREFTNSIRAQTVSIVDCDVMQINGYLVRRSQQCSMVRCANDSLLQEQHIPNQICRRHYTKTP